MMTNPKRRTWRGVAKVLALSVCVSVPVLALLVLGGSALGLLPGRTAAPGEFRALDTVPAPQASTAKPARAHEPGVVELTTWEKTLRPSNSE
jgi:hypothetical protein